MTCERALFIDSHDIAKCRDALAQNSLLGKTLRHYQAQAAAWLAAPVVIPGHGEGGGPEHLQHKTHYQMLHLAGWLWQFTQDPVWRDKIIAVLSGYADIYPHLGNATSKDTNPPGRLFHQTLNEDMFLLYAAHAWSCVKESTAAQTREHIENNLLRLMATEAVETHAATFDIVHNHGIWSVAAVGLCGYALNDQSLVDAALYGLKGDSQSGGFMAQISQLFSCDGFYVEGLYYQRFALRPLLMFAQAISRFQPELNIWQFAGKRIKAACYALFALAFPDGTLPALNDASKTMNLKDEGAVLAVSLCRQHYGPDARLAALAAWQGKLWPCAGALLLDREQPAGPYPTWPGGIWRDGPQGDKGGVGVLRKDCSQGDQTMALLWWGGHGDISGMHSALNHGHFDGLHLSLFNRGKEVLQDYGFGRWVNVEPKFGGRYIAENNSYCKQTVAHNTVTVDSGCQHQGNKTLATGDHGETHFFQGNHTLGSGMSAIARHYWPDVTQQRTVLLLTLPACPRPLLVDLFRLQSPTPHQYDYCLHIRGQRIASNISLQSKPQLAPLGNAHGYQHLWDCARGAIPTGEHSQISWLDGDTYYTITTAMPAGGELIIARTGASDPDNNLRTEPCWIWRTHASDTLFATVLESHGEFDEASEYSVDARGKVSQVNICEDSARRTQLQITFTDGSAALVTVDNRPGSGGFDAQLIAG
ncbi:chondroitin lyase [Mangrovibacter phragmitis]|uniref:Chondroitin lyase n=1 Tax=Mangrovibacter phragmitis TaxID=1691903 RepID=A0A1B7KZD4_9ENTR|nr:heparinase II/III family protein [Mangrovibacter phragmitis]OAT75373.1 chondroitin lyase [Mangrovibacter phragmitis]